MASQIPYAYMRREIRRRVKREVSDALYWRHRRRINAVKFYALLTACVLALLAIGGFIGTAGYWLFERFIG